MRGGYTRDRPPKSQPATGSARQAGRGTTDPQGRRGSGVGCVRSERALAGRPGQRHWLADLGRGSGWQTWAEALAGRPGQRRWLADLALRAKVHSIYTEFFMVRTWRVRFSACMGSRQVGLKAFDSGKRVVVAVRRPSVVRPSSVRPCVRPSVGLWPVWVTVRSSVRRPSVRPLGVPPSAELRSTTCGGGERSSEAVWWVGGRGGVCVVIAALPLWFKRSHCHVAWRRGEAFGLRGMWHVARRRAMAVEQDVAVGL